MENNISSNIEKTSIIHEIDLAPRWRFLQTGLLPGHWIGYGAPRSRLRSDPGASFLPCLAAEANTTQNLERASGPGLDFRFN